MALFFTIITFNNMKYLLWIVLVLNLLQIQAQKTDLYAYLQSCQSSNPKSDLYTYLSACKTTAEGENLSFFFPVGNLEKGQAWIYSTDATFALNKGGGIKIDTVKPFIFKKGVMNGTPTIIGIPTKLEPWQEEAINKGGGIKIDTVKPFIFKKTNAQGSTADINAYFLAERKVDISLYKYHKGRVRFHKGKSSFLVCLHGRCDFADITVSKSYDKFNNANNGSPNFAVIFQLYEEGEEKGMLVDFISLDEKGNPAQTSYYRVPFEQNPKTELYSFLQNCQKPASAKTALYNFLKDCKTEVPTTSLLSFKPKGKTVVKYEMYLTLPPQADVQALFAQSVQAQKYDMTIKTVPVPTKLPKNYGFPIYDPKGDLWQIGTSEGLVLDFGEKIPESSIYGIQGTWGVMYRTDSNGKGTRAVATANTTKPGLL